MQRFVVTVIVCVCAGCGFTRTEPKQVANPVSTSPREVPQTTEIVITDAVDLPKHVGQIVTLRGIQSRSKLPYVLGVYVDGQYELSDKMVLATGRLTSYETTAEDVKAFDRRMKESPFALPRISVGTHFRLTDPQTDEPVKTYLWSDRKR